ncbi:50S ribosomal protein L4P [Aeropyrum pernix K1]|uniref:Large ribosomal subunit protein uL4 n=1 Tax=Aeropyrum pernix (strain ATCC 700893 / DSM 11879 / JCM 9820 / NBRC 100138 / K1) TaxID=272557 RepID=RL4_AERPE|nr:50S ribosomal protein L4 [Aeropyrum pernix]Q9YFM1.3 RecName: Full=Large ribosomal subunit protein uL4; AltName: Full=50S ribosomal protein L4 [Aeropyrum pernix K1]BAA79140.2 50S ribosomal protein L4P [Aeropyrum pernix K1]
MAYTYMTLYMEQEKIVPVYDERGGEKDSVVLPQIFRFPVRKDLIRRAFLSEFTARLQPKGRDPMAGKRTSAVSLGVGRGVARVPRIKGSLRAALVNMARGGRAAHPPRVEKVLKEYINKKEKRLATISAISATSREDLVRQRGHRFSAETLPIVLDSSVLAKISTAREARSLLESVGVYEDVLRAKEGKRYNAGKGKMRGRRYKVPKSVLFVLEDPRSPLALAVKGMPGVDVVTPTLLSVLHLAPGGHPGRLTIYTTEALKLLSRRFEVTLP